MSKIKFTSIITLFLAIAILFAAGCGEQKKEEAQTDDKPNTSMSDTAMSETSSDPSSIEEPAVVIPDLIGTWTGKFDGHTTTLKITEQDSVSFKGNIVINYRDVINQQVSGKFDIEKSTFTMKDMIKGRYAGSYRGKISDEYNILAGTFFLKADNKTVSFNLKRKQ